jgi:putative transcriptional regulator
MAKPSSRSPGAAARRWRGVALLAALLAVCPALLTFESVLAQRLGERPLRQRVRDLAAGKFLIAARNLPDPNFGDSVVLLAQYGEEGAMGLIVNIRTDVPVSNVLGDVKGASGRSETVFFGGPVARTGVVALVRSRSAVAESRRILDDVHLVTSREPLEAILASGAGGDELRVYVGYAGWGAGQLEDETLRGSWHVVSADADLVFDAEPASLWRRQIDRTERSMMVRSVARRPRATSSVDDQRLIRARAQAHLEPRRQGRGEL